MRSFTDKCLTSFYGLAFVSLFVNFMCVGTTNAQRYRPNTPSYRPPTYRPPTYRPPTYRPPTYKRPTYKPPTTYRPTTRFPSTTRPQIVNRWTCSGCKGNLGTGSFPPSRCPHCNARIINGVGSGSGIGSSNPGIGGYRPPNSNPRFPTNVKSSSGPGSTPPNTTPPPSNVAPGSSTPPANPNPAPPNNAPVNNFNGNPDSTVTEPGDSDSEQSMNMLPIVLGSIFGGLTIAGIITAVAIKMNMG